MMLLMMLLPQYSERCHKDKSCHDDKLANEDKLGADLSWCVSDGMQVMSEVLIDIGYTGQPDGSSVFGTQRL